MQMPFSTDFAKINKKSEITTEMRDKKIPHTYIGYADERCVGGWNGLVA